MNNLRFYTILSCILFGLISRFFPHPPNFTALSAIALFSISIVGNLNRSLFTVFATMFLSDLCFGFHSTIFYVYASLGVIVLLGHFLSHFFWCLLFDHEFRRMADKSLIHTRPCWLKHLFSSCNAFYLQPAIRRCGLQFYSLGTS